MTLIEWKQDFEIGIPSVDHEHRELIELINTLHESLSGKSDLDRTVAVLGEINARISAHFALEEKEMRSMGYDEFADHKEDHERLLDEIRDIMDRVEDDRSWDYETELGTRLRDWFAEHFRTKDSRLHRFLINLS